MKQTVRKPSGVLTMLPYDGGAERQQDLIMCVHCGRHWAIGDAIANQLKHGGDITKSLGYCQKCDGVYCPGERCATCVPRMQRIENMEKGLPVLTPAPASISTAGLVLPF